MCKQNIKSPVNVLNIKENSVNIVNVILTFLRFHGNVCSVF